jgi:nucleoside-diphosphate-sugar epimerase
MRIIITGATGYVGSNLVPKLIQSGNELLEITIEGRKSSELYGASTLQFEYSKKNHIELIDVISKFNPDICIHLASYLSASDDYITMEKLLAANIDFTCHILDALKNTEIKTFINTGSFAEYHHGDDNLNPTYLYAAAKTASRIFVDYYSKTYNFNNLTVIPYTIYGGEYKQQKIIDIIYDSLQSNKAIGLSPGKQILDFIHVDDVTDFFVEVVNKHSVIPTNTSLPAGTGKGHTLRELATLLEKQTGTSANIDWGRKNYRPRDVMYAVADVSKHVQQLNWSAKISLDEGIRRYLDCKSS